MQQLLFSCVKVFDSPTLQIGPGQGRTQIVKFCHTGGGQGQQLLCRLDGHQRHKVAQHTCLQRPQQYRLERGGQPVQARRQIVNGVATTQAKRGFQSGMKTVAARRGGDLPQLIGCDLRQRRLNQRDVLMLITAQPVRTKRPPRRRLRGRKEHSVTRSHASSPELTTSCTRSPQKTVSPYLIGTPAMSKSRHSTQSSGRFAG